MEPRVSRPARREVRGGRGRRRGWLCTASGRAVDDRSAARGGGRGNDGAHVLRTTTDLPADEVAPASHEPAVDRTAAPRSHGLVAARRIYHHLVKANVKGHIVAGFLGSAPRGRVAQKRLPGSSGRAGRSQTPLPVAR